MYQVLLNDTVVAESANKPTVVEGNYYFAPEHVMMEYFTNSNTQEASYYNLKVGDTDVKDAAWYYPAPKEAASNIKSHVAFYKNKVVIKE